MQINAKPIVPKFLTVKLSVLQGPNDTCLFALRKITLPEASKRNRSV